MHRAVQDRPLARLRRVHGNDVVSIGVEVDSREGARVVVVRAQIQRNVFVSSVALQNKGYAYMPIFRRPLHRAEQLKRLSYFLRLRAQNIAGWAFMLRRDAATMRHRGLTSTSEATPSRRE